jgi:hypothetical protein
LLRNEAWNDHDGATFSIGALTREIIVKRFTFIGATAGVAVLATGLAFAQDATVVIAPEHEKVIKDYVVQEHVRPVDVDTDFTVGATVPENVELAPVPERIYTTAPEVKKYRYFYWKDHVVFVDPDTRRIVDVVD